MSVRCIQKSNGKLLCDEDKLRNDAYFHALNVDARGGKVELIGAQLKLVFQLNGDAGNR